MKKRLIPAVVLIMMSGVILFGAIKIIDATQTDKQECNGQHPFNSIILEKQGTPCCPRSIYGNYSAHITAIEAGRPLVQRQQRARSSRDEAAVFEELKGFLVWAGAIMRDTPITTNNFLAKELESHLLGKKTTFHPERITRAFEMIERHGRTSGLQRLKDKDPELAAEVERFLEENSSLLGKTIHRTRMNEVEKGVVLYCGRLQFIRAN